MTNTNSKRKRHLVVVNAVILEIRIFVMLWVAMYILFRRRRGSRNWSRTRYTISNKVPYQINHLRDVVGISDDICRNNLRMPIQCFHRCVSFWKILVVFVHPNMLVLSRKFACFCQFCPIIKKMSRYKLTSSDRATPLVYISTMC